MTVYHLYFSPCETTYDATYVFCRAVSQNAAVEVNLTDRETEVLTLYAMGLTQAKIAEELCIAPGTAHTHVKRIYSKTDLHSRQALLDYIERYTD